MFPLYFPGCDILRNASWLVDSKNDQNCLLLEDRSKIPFCASLQSWHQRETSQKTRLNFYFKNNIPGTFKSGF